MAKITEAAAEFRIKEVMVGMITAALGFVTALVWRDAIQQTIDAFVPTGEGLIYTYLAAVLVTIIAMAAIFILYRIQRANIIPDVWEEKVKRAARLKRKKK